MFLWPGFSIERSLSLHPERMPGSSLESSKDLGVQGFRVQGFRGLEFRGLGV